MNKGKLAVLLLLGTGMSLGAKSFGDMNLNQIESVSYNKLSPADQDELIKLAIFSGNINHIVPGTLAHRNAARTVLENEFGPQDWVKFDFMLNDKDKGIQAVKQALAQGTNRPYGVPKPERRPLKIEEAEPVEQTPPPLPPRPTVSSQNAANQEALKEETTQEVVEQTPPPLPPRPAALSQDIVNQPVLKEETTQEVVKQTPPPLPPRPQAKPVEQSRPALPFKAQDLQLQSGQLNHVELPAKEEQEGSLKQQLNQKFKGANDQQELEEDDWD